MGEFRLISPIINRQAKLPAGQGPDDKYAKIAHHALVQV